MFHCVYQMKAMTFYYTLKPTKDTRQRLKAQGLRDCTYQGWDWKDPIAKKKKRNIRRIFRLHCYIWQPNNFY